jgi:adenylate cyclase, class 2
MIEAELKARVRDPDEVRRRLEDRAPPEDAVYHDAYFDWPDGSLMRAGRELRLRTIDQGNRRRGLLTSKDPAVDASGSKPEHETGVADPATVAAILNALGLRQVVAFSKRCTNFTFGAGGRRVVATLALVPELDGTFLEVETLVASVAELEVALQMLREVLGDLGIDEADLTTELYTDMVARRHVAPGD